MSSSYLSLVSPPTVLPTSSSHTRFCRADHLPIVSMCLCGHFDLRLLSQAIYHSSIGTQHSERKCKKFLIFRMKVFGDFALRNLTAASWQCHIHPSPTEAQGFASSVHSWPFSSFPVLSLSSSEYVVLEQTLQIRHGNEPEFAFSYQAVWDYSRDRDSIHVNLQISKMLTIFLTMPSRASTCYLLI